MSVKMVCNTHRRPATVLARHKGSVMSIQEKVL